MPECLVCVELYGVTDYTSLNDVMQQDGFEATITSKDKLTCRLPTGTYRLPAGIEPSRRTALERAKVTVMRALQLESAEVRRLNELPAILVVDAEDGVVWSGLAPEPYRCC